MMNDAVIKLNKELAELRKFLILLSAEQQSLLNNDAETLLSLSDEKTQAAKHLIEMRDSRRLSLLTRDLSSMEIWVEKQAPNCQGVWSEIRKLAAQAQHLNTTNGELIQSRMRHNQQALNVLYNSSKNATGIYGRDGQANLGSSGRHLGSG